jgi:hypothetical protein
MTESQTIELPPVQNLDVPAAWAPEDQREAIKGILQEMLAGEWSRPMIISHTQFTDSQVYRAKEGAAHTVEVERWNAFLQGVKNGTFKPTPKARKANALQLAEAALDNARLAAARLAEANQFTKAADIKKIVAEALALLPTPVNEDPAEVTDPAEAPSEDPAEVEVPAQGDARD